MNLKVKLFAINASWIVLVVLLSQSFNTSGNIIVQDLDCNEYEPIKLKVIRLRDRDQEYISSHISLTIANEQYRPNRDCAVSIIGKDRYQFEVTLQKMDVNSGDVAGKCHDFIKLYNGPRVDNAFLMTPQQGLCGHALPKIKTFKTIQNFITIFFKTKKRLTSEGGSTGFSLFLKQYKWTNPGNLNPGGISPGGWNDGASNEFQSTWDQQNRVPGTSGGNKVGIDYEKSKNGIKCYHCSLCSIRDFDEDRDSYSLKSGCFMCGKEWDEAYGSAQRVCYSERSYTAQLQSFGDPEINSGKITKLLGCHVYANPYGQKVNYCFCDSSLCNMASHLTAFFPGLFFAVLVKLIV